MARNRMPGHGEGNGEKSLAEKAAIALGKRWVKRWLEARVKDAREGKVTMNRQALSKLLALLSSLLAAVAVAVGSSDWSQIIAWATSNGPAAISAIGALVTALMSAWMRTPKGKPDELVD